MKQRLACVLWRLCAVVFIVVFWCVLGWFLLSLFSAGGYTWNLRRR